MVAGGFRTFVAGETLDENKINDFLMQGVLVFADAAARDLAITAPVHGQVAFLKDTNTTVFYDGSSWESLAAGIELRVLAVGGGGAGGSSGISNTQQGGGGAGSANDRTFLVEAGSVLPVLVGAGAAAGLPPGFGDVVTRVSGNRSFLSPIIGGGGTTAAGGVVGGNGTRGGDSPGNFGGAFLGGLYFFSSSGALQGAGGGAGSAGDGVNGASGNAGDGGPGLSSDITGTAINYAGGGGGGKREANNTRGFGTDGGGDGGYGTQAGFAGSANTGGGGGGGGSASVGGNGGSGVVIFRVPTGTSVSFTGGVTESSTTVGLDTVYTITAAGPTDTVTIG